MDSLVEAALVSSMQTSIAVAVVALYPSLLGKRKPSNDKCTPEEIAKRARDRRALLRLRSRQYFPGAGRPVLSTFKVQYRVDPETFEYILQALTTHSPTIRRYLDEDRVGRPAGSVPLQHQLGAFLALLGNNLTKQRLSDGTLGMARATWQDAINRIATGIMEAVSAASVTGIHWPVATEAERKAFASSFVCMAARMNKSRRSRGRSLIVPIPGVLGAADGTLVRIRRPSPPEYDEQAYVDRYGQHSLKLHVIVGPRKEVLSFSCGESGRSSDSTTLQTNAPLQARMAAWPEEYHLLADSGYACTDRVLTPYKDDQKGSATLGVTSAMKTFYNECLQAMRSIVENAIGDIKGRFPLLAAKVPLNPRLATTLLYCAVCLHNICVARRDEVPGPAKQDSEQIHEQATDAVGGGRRTKRDYLAARLFQKKVELEAQGFR